MMVRPGGRFLIFRRSGRGIPAAGRLPDGRGATSAPFVRSRGLHGRPPCSGSHRRTVPHSRARKPGGGTGMAIDTAPTGLTQDEIVALSKRHSLYEWSAQSAVDPIPVDACRGRLLLHARRQALPRLQQPADVREHRPWRPARHRGHQGPGSTAGLRQPVHGHRAARPPGPEAGRDHARRHRRLLLHQRRRGGERERHQAGPPVHRSPEDPGALPLVPRRDGPGHRGHRRPAPLGGRDRRRRASSASPTPPLGPQGSRAGRREPRATSRR